MKKIDLANLAFWIMFLAMVISLGQSISLTHQLEHCKKTCNCEIIINPQPKSK